MPRQRSVERGAFLADLVASTARRALRTALRIRGARKQEDERDGNDEPAAHGRANCKKRTPRRGSPPSLPSGSEKVQRLEKLHSDEEVAPRSPAIASDAEARPRVHRRRRFARASSTQAAVTLLRRGPDG